MSKTFIQPFHASPRVGYNVTVDGKSILITCDYLLAQACALSWRKHHPREDKNRASVSIVV